MNNIKVKASTPCYENGITLTPYVTDDGEVWLASEGNGCGDDVMLEDIRGWAVDEISAKWSDIDLDALRVCKRTLARCRLLCSGVRTPLMPPTIRRSTAVPSFTKKVMSLSESNAKGYS